MIRLYTNTTPQTYKDFEDFIFSDEGNTFNFTDSTVTIDSVVYRLPDGFEYADSNTTQITSDDTLSIDKQENVISVMLKNQGTAECTINTYYTLQEGEYIAFGQDELARIDTFYIVFGATGTKQLVVVKEIIRK